MRYTRKYLVCLLFWILSSVSYAQLNKAYFFYQGEQMISQGKFRESLRYLNTLIEADSTLYEGWFMRGVAKFYLDDYRGAISDFSRAIKINPVLMQAYHYRASVKNQLGQYRDALKDLDFVISSKPSNPEFVFTRGVTYFQLQDFPKAIEDFSRVIKLSPNNPDAWLNRATSKLFIGDTLGSINDYSNAIRYNPFYAISYARRGQVFYEQRKFALAFVDLNKAVQLDSTSTLNYFNRALIQSALGNIKAAIEDFDRVLKLDPKNSHSLYNRAIMKSQIGSFNEALEDYNRLVELNPKNIFGYYNRGTVLMELNRYQDAIDDYSKAIELFPEFANAYINRSVSKQRIGNIAGAEQDYQTANRIINKYKSLPNDAYAAMADTSKKFNTLLSLNTDFSTAKSEIRPMDELKISSGFLPFFTINVARTGTEDNLLDNQNPQINQLNSNLISGYQFLFTNKQNVAFLSDSLLAKKKESLKHFVSGIALSNIKKYNLALQEYQKASQLEPNNILIRLNLAVEKIEMIQYIQQFDNELNSVSFGRKTETTNKNSKSTNINYSEGLKEMEELERLDPSLSVIPYNIGNTYFLMEDIESAISAYSRAIIINSKFTDALYNRGLAYLIVGDKAKGCIDISKAGELGLVQSYSLIQKYCK